jgi:hypothetical protein
LLHLAVVQIAWNSGASRFEGKQKPLRLLSQLHKTDSLISGPIPSVGDEWFQIQEQNHTKETSHRGISQKDHIRVALDASLIFPPLPLHRWPDIGNNSRHLRESVSEKAI